MILAQIVSNDNRVFAWLDDRKVFRNWPVAFWNKC